ncbi:MFS transporter [Kitasatospora indigofera]|uniref:MFS transporter n=1 Tax=Kitasatospora indigofera TaxID=67307 RepID=A0A919D7K7_9ACTN|nr:MFS transporter [Kitasatospora indigofera]GHE25397.1 MFS transporter [Kitasatospora indigofera]
MGDQQEARRARVGFSVVFAVHGAVTGTFVTRIPWIQHHLHLNAGQLGIALLAPAVGAFLAMPLAGHLAHRYGPRAAVRALMASWCLSLALPALAPDLLLLWSALFLYGATSGMASVQLNAQGVEVERRLGRSIMSGLHGMWSAGGLVASGFGVLAANQQVDARIQLAVTSLALTALAVLACNGLADTRAGTRADTGPDPRPAAGRDAGPDAEQSPRREAPPRFALPPRSALAIGLVGFCAVFAEGASMDWAGVYLRDVTGASPGIAAASFTAFAATMTAARLSGDLAVRRLGPVRTVRAGGAVATLGGLLVISTGSPYLAIPGFGLIGIGIAAVVPLAFAAAGRTADPGRAIAGVATITYTASLSAPAAIGLIAQSVSLTASFALVAVLTAALVGTAGALRQNSTAPHRRVAARGGSTSGNAVNATARGTSPAKAGAEPTGRAGSSSPGSTG